MIWLNGFLCGLLLAAGVWAIIRARLTKHERTLQDDLHALERLPVLTSDHFRR